MISIAPNYVSKVLEIFYGIKVKRLASKGEYQLEICISSYKGKTKIYLKTTLVFPFFTDPGHCSW